MSKVLKRVVKYGKKSLKAILHGCGLLTEQAFIYKKVAWAIILILIFTIIFYFNKDTMLTALSNTIVVSEAEIVARVRKHTTLPEGKPTSIVRVKDADALRAQHIFYKDVKEGDYIIMYPDRVIIYDLRDDSVVAQKASQ